MDIVFFKQTYNNIDTIIVFFYQEDNGKMTFMEGWVVIRNSISYLSHSNNNGHSYIHISAPAQTQTNRHTCKRIKKETRIRAFTNTNTQDMFLGFTISSTVTMIIQHN